VSDGDHVQPTRRNMVSAVIGGALLGSAWGLGLRQTSSHDGTPAVTAAWNRSGSATLIEHKRQRVILLDCPEADRQPALVELVTGFMRQRIDVLIASDDTLAALPADLADRWKISQILASDAHTSHPRIGFCGWTLAIDTLTISGQRVNSGQWLATTSGASGSYLDVRLGKARIAVVTRATLLPHISLDADRSTLLIITDGDVHSLRSGSAHLAIAAPSDAPLFDRGDEFDPDNVVRLYRDTPVTFRLAASGVNLPSQH
jgi:hypothetical protein